MTLRATLNQLASEFALNVLQAIRSASLQELLSEAGAPRGARPRAAAAAPRGHAAPSARKGGRLGRRSAQAIADVIDSIVALLQKHPNGLRAEEIRSALGLQSKELPRPIAEALAKRRITKQGKKRATTYFARSGGASAANGAKSTRKRAKKAGKGAQKHAGKHAAQASTASSNGAA